MKTYQLSNGSVLVLNHVEAMKLNLVVPSESEKQPSIELLFSNSTVVLNYDSNDQATMTYNDLINHLNAA